MAACSLDATAGLVTGLTLIVAIGAQNAYVLRQGLLRAHVGVVVAICAVSDLVLILAGVGGDRHARRAGTDRPRRSSAGSASRFLTWYGVSSLLRALRPDALRAADRGAATRRTAVLTALALTWLNPHVYLDTVLMLGSIANQHGTDGRWWFGGGAGRRQPGVVRGLGWGARRASGLLSSARAWRVLDVLIGLTMLGIAAMLAVG